MSLPLGYDSMVIWSHIYPPTLNKNLFCPGLSSCQASVNNNTIFCPAALGHYTTVSDDLCIVHDAAYVPQLCDRRCACGLLGHPALHLPQGKTQNDLL